MNGRDKQSAQTCAWFNDCTVLNLRRGVIVGWAKRGYIRYLMEKQDGTVSQAPLNHCWMASANPPTSGFAPDGRLILETSERSNDCACIQFVGSTGPKSVLNLCNWGCESRSSAHPVLHSRCCVWCCCCLRNLIRLVIWDAQMTATLR